MIGKESGCFDLRSEQGELFSRLLFNSLFELFKEDKITKCDPTVVGYHVAR